MRDAPAETAPLAIVSLVFGILGWVALPVIGAVIAVVTGHIARGQVRDARGDLHGDGLAMVGLVLGYLSLALVLFSVMLFLIFGAGLLALLAVA